MELSKLEAHAKHGDMGPYSKQIAELIAIIRKQEAELAKPAAAPVSGDVALPEIRCYLMVDGYDHETNGMDQFSGGRTGGVPLVALPDARTYGQQCSDAALERAAKAIDEFADKHLTGDDLKCALALIDVVRALKGGE